MCKLALHLYGDIIDYYIAHKIYVKSRMFASRNRVHPQTFRTERALSQARAFLQPARANIHQYQFNNPIILRI